MNHLRLFREREDLIDGAKRWAAFTLTHQFKPSTRKMVIERDSEGRERKREIRRGIERGVN